jgi:hypothetical protein
MKTIKYTVFLAVLLFTTVAFAQAVTRQVNLNWNATTVTGATGYNLYRGTTSGGPYTKVNSTLIPVGTNQFQDTATTKVLYFYVVTVVTPPCTLTTPITTPCGESAFSAELSVPVPDRPASTTSTFNANVP